MTKLLAKPPGRGSIATRCNCRYGGRSDAHNRATAAVALAHWSRTPDMLACFIYAREFTRSH